MDSDAKWRCLDSKKVFEAKDGKTVFMELYEDRVKTLSGKVITYARYFSSDVVIIVPFLQDGRLLMINQYRYPPDKYMLEFPAGHVDKNEDVRMTAARELREETGYSASTMELVYKYHPSVSKSRQIVNVFRASGLTPGAAHHDENETIQVRIVSVEDLGKMIITNEVDSAGTLIAYFLCCTGIPINSGTA